MMSLDLSQVAAAAGLLGGACALLIGLIHFFAPKLPRDDSYIRPPGAADHPHPRHVTSLVLLVLIVVGASYLRLHDLDAQTLSHTEAIVPNIDWPAGVSWPPARHSFYDTFWWHFHSEGHPPAYYFLMWAWTTLFGTGLVALRLPSALFGIGSVVLVYLLGKRLYNHRVGTLAAAMIALNGFHIHWSQYARMYMMACFMGLLSTYLLLLWIREPSNRRVTEVAFVVTSAIAIYTQTFYWTVLAAQIVWVLLQGREFGNIATKRLISLQAMVVMMGAAALAHIAYLGDDVTLPGPSVAFFAHFLSFGFLFEPDGLSIPPRVVPLSYVALTALLAILLVARAPAQPAHRIEGRQQRLATPDRTMAVIALGSSLLVLAFASLAHRRQLVMALVALLPILSLALPRAVHLLDGTKPYLRRGAPLDRMLGLAQVRMSLPLTLLVIPVLGITILSFWTSMMAPRAFLMFTPFLTLLIAAGTFRTARSRVTGTLMGVAFAMIHAVSINHFARYPNDQIDYANLGRQVDAHLQPDDLLFVLPRSWVITPVFYYLDADDGQFVGRDYESAIRTNPDARVWLFEFDSRRWGKYGTTSEEMTEALEGHAVAERFASRRGRALLYVADDQR